MNLFCRKTLLLILISLTSCGGSVKQFTPTVFVSIAPLAYIVEQIADSSVRVEVLVPETTSPETYEPTTMQVQRLSSAQIYINTGLIDFEVALNKSIASLSDSLRIVDLSKGIEVLAGSCSHSYGGGNHAGHSHGTDPHTWLSPRLMRGFAVRIKESLDEVYPANRETHTLRLAQLLERIDTLDSYIKSKKIGNFAIAHPSLTYFARDYGVEQVAIEIEGKEPTIAQMKEIIERLRSEKTTKIFYQKQTSAAAAETIAREIGAEVVEFDPLAINWIENLRFITDQISAK